MNKDEIPLDIGLEENFMVMGGKDMLSFEDCIFTMNPKEYADCPIYQYGMVDFNEDGKSPCGMRYKVSDNKFGVLAGKSLNPLIFRGENMEYEHFCQVLNEDLIQNLTI